MAIKLLENQEIVSPIPSMTDEVIAKNISRFVRGEGKNGGREIDERYASFDYCFNYFRSFRKNHDLKDLASPEHVELSCLHLGFYLASWGMLRGSSFLLEKSVRYYRNLIQNIGAFNPRIWGIDVEDYGKPVDIALLLECMKMISASLGRESVSDTLTTKIMLGVFGNVPAFDGQFKRGFRVGALNEKSLERIFRFYLAHKATIDAYADQLHTFGFLTGRDTEFTYTHAKIIDMIFFIEGSTYTQSKGRNQAALTE